MHCERWAKVDYLRLVPLLSINGFVNNTSILNKRLGGKDGVRSTESEYGVGVRSTESEYGVRSA